MTIDQLALLDSDEREIDSPFLDLPLPSADGRRVAILLHPGRVKSGLQANLRLGRALQRAEKVTLVIRHPELGPEVRKEWEVTASDIEPPQPERWTFEPPREGTLDPVVVQLDGPVSSTAESQIAIAGPDRERVAGMAHLEAGETLWRFTPTQPWRASRYAVVVLPDLEDTAGNRPGALFEGIGASRVRSEAAILAFPVRATRTEFTP